MQHMFKFIAISLISLFTFNAHAETVKDLFHAANAPIGGNPDGKITVVEFFDYRCALCVYTSEAIDDIVKSNPNVRVVYMDYPILGPISDSAARAALAANKQGRYQELSQTLLLGHSLYSEDVIFDTAKLLGLDLDRLDKDMGSDAITDQLKMNYALAQEFNIHSTPAFIVGKTDAKDSKDVKFIVSEISKDRIEEAINEVSKS